MSKSDRERLENTFPLNTFPPETKRLLVEFVLQEIAKAWIDENATYEAVMEAIEATAEPLLANEKNVAIMARNSLRSELRQSIAKIFRKESSR